MSAAERRKILSILIKLFVIKVAYETKENETKDGGKESFSLFVAEKALILSIYLALASSSFFSDAESLSTTISQ